MNTFTKLKFMLVMVAVLFGIGFNAMAQNDNNRDEQADVWDGTWTAWTHGSGTQSDPYLIESAENLAYLAYRVNNGLGSGSGHAVGTNLYYKLMVDIDLNGSQNMQWTPIGYWSSNDDYFYFAGHFLGNNHVISNMLISNTDNKYTGFFAYVGEGSIKDLTLDESCFISINTANTDKSIGGIIGEAFDETVYNCTYLGNISVSGFPQQWNNLPIGGIIGRCRGIIIDMCNSNATIVSNISSGSRPSIGGILGRLIAGAVSEISNCCNYGSTSTAIEDSFTGGIIGSIGDYNSQVVISDCFNNGNNIKGGIVGTNDSNKCSVQRCYNTGSNCNGGIIGTTNVSISVMYCYNTGSARSGIIGNNNAGYSYYVNINSCYNTGNVTDGCIVGGSYSSVNNCYYLNTCGGSSTNGGVAKTAVFMRDPEFVEVLNLGSNNFIQDAEPFLNDGFPILRWQPYIGITENKLTDVPSLNVFPNPANDFVNISSKDMKEFAVYNSIGDLIARQQCTDSELIQVAVSNFANGIYYIQMVFKNGKTSSKRLIISH